MQQNQSNQFFFPIMHEANTEPSQLKRILELYQYKGTNKLHHRLTIPYVCSITTPFGPFSSQFTLQFNTPINDIYYDVERFAEFDNYIIELVNFYTETLDQFEFNSSIFFPEISTELLQKRYDNCSVIDPNKSAMIKKPAFENITTEPYLWNRNSNKLQVPEHDADGNITVNNTKYEKSFELPTLHKLEKSQYHFEPTLHDVLSQLPSGFGTTEPFIVTTEMFSNDPNIVLQGDYHIGITTVYTPLIEHGTKKQKTDDLPAPVPNNQDRQDGQDNDNDGFIGF